MRRLSLYAALTVLALAAGIVVLFVLEELAGWLFGISGMGGS